MQQILAGVADQMKNFAVIYLVDISEVPDFNTMYELYDPCTVMFFFRNKVSGMSFAIKQASKRCRLGLSQRPSFALAVSLISLAGACMISPQGWRDGLLAIVPSKRIVQGSCSGRDVSAVPL